MYILKQHATQQYPKRTREQVVNDRYILKQNQEVLDDDTVVVRSSANNDGDHVNEEKQRQEIERDNDNNNENGDNHGDGDGAKDDVDKKDPAKVKQRLVKIAK